MTGRVRWDQAGFEKLKAAWSSWRVMRDRQRLNKIFNLAACSPTFAAALAWAKKHEVQFFVDHSVVNCGGYYAGGTGIIGIGKKRTAQPDPRSAAILAHEIRHAWQDYHGLLARPVPGDASGTFADFFIKKSLMEADAAAFESLVEDEMNQSLNASRSKLSAWLPWKKTSSRNLDEIQQTQDRDSLRREFLGWFSNPDVTVHYGDYSSKEFGQRLALYPGALPERRYEFEPEDTQAAGIDISSYKTVLQLGQGFDGKNYLAGLPHEVFAKRILRPSLAGTFYGAANDQQRKLVTDIRKSELKQKMAQEQERKSQGMYSPLNKWLKTH